MDCYELIRQRLTSINSVIPTSLPLARSKTLKAMDALGIERKDYPKLYADSFTCCLRQMFSNDPIGDWRVVGKSNCLHMIDDVSKMRIRFLKSFAFTGGLPPAGRNRSRACAWCQESFSGFTQGELAMPQLLDSKELILAWTERGTLIECTAYLPSGTGKYPQGAPAKALMTMPIGIEPVEYGNLSFTSDDTEERIVPESNTVINETEPMNKQ